MNQKRFSNVVAHVVYLHETTAVAYFGCGSTSVLHSAPESTFRLALLLIHKTFDFSWEDPYKAFRLGIYRRGGR